MDPKVATVVGVILIVLGIGLFPFAALAVLYWLGGSAGPLWVIAVFDGLLLLMGATTVVSLWSNRDASGNHGLSAADDRSTRRSDLALSRRSERSVNSHRLAPPHAQRRRRSHSSRGGDAGKADPSTRASALGRA